MSITNMYQLENLVLGLLETLNDKNSDVQESVSQSLISLGNKKPDFVLKNSYQFVSKNINKLTETHKVSIFNTIEKIVKENIDSLDEKLSLQWIEITSNEMIQNKDKEQPILLQTASSDLLVIIGKKYVKEVFQQLQKNFIPGQLPHLFVLKTMANLAEANPFGVVPSLTTILPTMLPMIGMSKLDSFKCAFASAYCKFSEAIIFYCSNKEKAPDSSIDKNSFSSSIYAAHEVFNIWLKTNDVKLRQLVIESIGHFVSLMPREKLETDLVKIFPNLLSLYKRHPDLFIVSQSLYMTISAVVTADPAILIVDTLFDSIIKEMFAQILVTVEHQFVKNQQQLNLITNVKNQNELLRCFAELAKRFSDKMVPFLVQKFEQKDEKIRISSLIVVKHLINSCEEEMTNKKQLLISGLRLLLNETSNRVKKNLLQVIIAMAYHDYLSLEGGHSMIEFILKQSNLQEIELDKKQANNIPEDSTNEQLKLSADSILTLFSTTVENMHSILWPHLFEYLTLNEYSRSVSQLCKNLAHIADVLRSSNSDSYLIQFDQFINLPKPIEILTRLIVLCGVPLANKNRGLNVLQLMKNISPNLSSQIVELWDNVVPKLIINLEDKITNSKFNQKNWEDLIMKLFNNTMDQINDEDKICDIAKSFGSQIETLYANSVDEKYFAYKCLGIALNKTSSKTTIDRQLDIMFQTVNHNSQVEREGFAISFGYCASIHLDTVLLKLENFSKNETKKSSGGLFSSILNSKQAEPDLVKATLVLAYGYCTNFAQKDLIISRLETYILRNVGGYASGQIKDIILKQNILKSIDLITKCMHHDHLQKDFSFSYKTTLFNQIISYITNDTSKLITNDIKSQCFKVCSNIVKLNPKPTEADMYQLIKSSTDSFFPLQVPPEDKKSSQAESTDLDSMSQALNEINLMHGNTVYETTAKSLDELLQSILNRDLTTDGFNFIFKHLEPWITSLHDHERLRSIRCLSNCLKYFADNFKILIDENNPKVKSSFDCFGNILGLVITRITDPVIPIRLLTIECLESLLKILIVYGENEALLTEKEKHFEHLNLIKQKLTKNDSNILLSAVSDLAKQLCKIIQNTTQLITFIEKLIDGLLDIQSHCSSASCIFLNTCIKLRGNELKEHVDNILRHLYAKLSLIQNNQAKTGTLRSIRIMFQQHLIESLNVILTFPIPCNNADFAFSNRSILIHEEIVDHKKITWLEYRFYNTMDFIDICQILCEDSQLIQEILDHLLQIWNRCLPYEEKNNVKYASMTPLIGTCILSEIFSNNTTANTEQVFNQNFEKIFSSLMVRISSSLSNQMPIPKAKDDSASETSANSTSTHKKDDNKNSTKALIQAEYKKLDPCKIAIECFKNFVKCTQSFDLFEFYENEKVWDLLAAETTNVEGCFILARGLCFHGQKYIPNVINNLNVYLSAPYDCQKKSVTAFFAELVNHKCILSHVEQLMNNLLSKLIDTYTPVRTLCIRGLGNIASLGKEEVQKHSTTILSAMMAGLDDKDDINDDITLESMNGLTKIIALIDENNVRPILINILLRIRPCFEKDKGTIRASAYLLFGELARFGKGPSKDPYMEQIHSNFVSFILHLNESDENVIKACKSVLRSVGPLIESNQVNDLFQTGLIDNKSSFHYGEFLNDLAKLLANEFPEKISFYIMNSVSNFKSQWTEIRCNAVLFAGFMLGHLSKDKQSLLSKEHITNALIKLLREDPSPSVRQRAAEAISLLSEF